MPSTVRKQIDDLTEKIIGAAIKVHRTLGPGLLESIYEEALCIELELRGINFDRQVEIDIHYKGHAIKGRPLALLTSFRQFVEVPPLPWACCSSTLVTYR
jgi:GxxExxY protein